MTYYMGDYYQGDYYQGDPGFFSFLGRLAKGAVGLVKGVTGLGGGGIKMAPQTAMTLPARATGILRKVGPMVVKGMGTRGGKIAAGVLGAGALAGAVGAGMHISRKTGQPVRNRRMRVTNPKALRRALRRTHGFAKLAMKTIHLVHPRKKARFGGFKKRRRSA